MPPLKSLVGQRFGRLVVTTRAEHVTTNEPLGKHIYWTCKCDCGTLKHVQGDNLKSGDIRSCGCLLRELEAAGGGAKTHGLRKSAEYEVWAGMIARCTNKKHKSYKGYGGRGIRVCERWKDFASFFADMGSRPSSKYSVERVNNDGNYEPGNCRWATALEQARNKRPRGCGHNS